MDWVSAINELGGGFAARSAEHDSEDSFVSENYAALRDRKIFSAGVPAELGGGGASHRELCDIVRRLAYHCGSTGLAFSMHTHLIATMAYGWRKGNKAPEGLLRRVAAEDLILISTGGSDWLTGSGTLEKTDGGYRMNGRKVFGSGCPSGDVLMTTGVYADPENGPTVIHFPLSLKAEGVKILDTWRTLGMRATGSHDIEITNAFVPDAAMGGVRRTPGKWHPFMHTVVLVALPIIYSAYVGVAERARDIALGLAVRRKNDPAAAMVAGELENHFVTAQLAYASMLDLTAAAEPGENTSSDVLARRTIVARAILQAADKAMELGSGAGFYRSTGLERCFRDVQGARYHPVPEKVQTQLTGRHLLGLPFDA